MARISTKERAQAATRARTALQRLEEHPATSRNQLGAARDQLNIVGNWKDAQPVWDAVYAIERIVTTVYRGRPTTS